MNKVFFYVPNLIGYFRVFLAIVSLNYLPVHPHFAISLYALSSILDALDGVAARYLNQSMLQTELLHSSPFIHSFFSYQL